MYIPPHFAASDRAEVFALMRAHPFATLVTVGGDGSPLANHLPFLVDDGDPPVLLAHMAYGNPQWRQFEDQALVIFHGPHGYVSPSLYQHGPVDSRVPTWNYVAVHAMGKPRILDDEAAQRLLERLTAAHEAPRAEPWHVDMHTPARKAMLQAIVAFAIDVTRLEGKLKLSQNRAPGDRQLVREAHAASDHPDDQELAALMARR